MFTLIAAGMAETGNAPEKFGETRDLVSFGKFGFKSQSRRIIHANVSTSMVLLDKVMACNDN